MIHRAVMSWKPAFRENVDEGWTGNRMREGPGLRKASCRYSTPPARKTQGSAALQVKIAVRIAVGGV
jgi:hypothetical protein